MEYLFLNFFAKPTVIWRHFYKVKTCDQADIEACWDFTHELKGIFVRCCCIWFWAFTFYNTMRARMAPTWIPWNPLSAVSECRPWLQGFQKIIHHARLITLWRKGKLRINLRAIKVKLQENKGKNSCQIYIIPLN